jgi:hypothetical protein
MTATEPDDNNEPDLESALRTLTEFQHNAPAILAQVDQMAAKCEDIIENVRRERAREKRRNLLACVAGGIISAILGCLLGALVFGR